MNPPVRDADDPRYRWVVLFIVMLGTLMAVLDIMIVNIALPNIQAAFGSPLDSIEWVVTAYMLSFACFMPLTSWAAGRFGNKNVYVFSLSVFTLGSALCAMAWNLPSLVVARAIQALGGAAIIPIGMTLVSGVFPPRERGKALGIWGVGVVMGPAFGPTLGGYLTETLGWRSIFVVNLPLGLLTVAACLALLKSDHHEASTERTLDWGGFLFLAMFLAGFLLGVSKGESDGWTSVTILSYFAMSALGAIGFLLVESLVPHPIVDLTLLKIPVFSATLMVTAVRGIGMFGGAFLLPLFMRQQMGLTEIGAGLVLLPGALIIAVAMPVAGRLADRMGPRYLVMTGLFLMAWFCWSYRDLDASTSVWGVINPTFLRGLGIALLMAPVMSTAINAVPKASVAMASMMLNLLQQMSGSTGVAALATVLIHRTTHHMAALGAGLDFSTGTAQQVMAGLIFRLHDLGRGPAEAALGAQIAMMDKVVHAAAVRAYDDTFVVAAVASLAAIFAALLLPARHPETHAAEADGGGRAMATE
jgi:DHA2 family multidrug resistance protein